MSILILIYNFLEEMFLFFEINGIFFVNQVRFLNKYKFNYIYNIRSNYLLYLIYIIFHLLYDFLLKKYEKKNNCQYHINKIKCKILYIKIIFYYNEHNYLIKYKNYFICS